MNSSVVSIIHGFSDSGKFGINSEGELVIISLGHEYKDKLLHGMIFNDLLQFEYHYEYHYEYHQEYHQELYINPQQLIPNTDTDANEEKKEKKVKVELELELELELENKLNNNNKKNKKIKQTINYGSLKRKEYWKKQKQKRINKEHRKRNKKTFNECIKDKLFNTFSYKNLPLESYSNKQYKRWVEWDEKNIFGVFNTGCHCCIICKLCLFYCHCHVRLWSSWCWGIYYAGYEQ